MKKHKVFVENYILNETNVQTDAFVSQDLVTSRWHITVKYKDDQGVNYVKSSSGFTREEAVDVMISKIMCNIY